jgi:hypothetical protein
MRVIAIFGEIPSDVDDVFDDVGAEFLVVLGLVFELLGEQT